MTETHPVAATRLKKAMRHGAALIVADPRRFVEAMSTTTAAVLVLRSAAQGLRCLITTSVRLRLRAFEAIEAGAYENEQQVAKLAGQCQLCTDLAAFFDEAIIIEEIDNDSD